MQGLLVSDLVILSQSSDKDEPALEFHSSNFTPRHRMYLESRQFKRASSPLHGGSLMTSGLETATGQHPLRVRDHHHCGPRVRQRMEYHIKQGAEGYYDDA
ncbi:hypothetical protein TNCV_4683651 [Trichonephila clavipes]|nr:hypothetical protein TNCV_4683651 [Trichonephila clavipes]